MNSHQQHQEQQVIVLLVMAAVAFWLFCRPKWRGSGTAFGTARWASDKMLFQAKMIAGQGLILGRTISGKLLWNRTYVHTLLIGGTGSGKGVSVLLPILLSCFRGSCVVFDPKGDLYAITARRRRKKGHKIIRLSPFNGGTDSFNPLDTIDSQSLTLVDSARSMAESLVFRDTGSAADRHWDDRSVIIATGLIVLTCLRFVGEERSLNTVQEIASDPDMVRAAAGKLREIGGIPGRLGNQLASLFDKDGGLTKEGAGVLSTVTRHLSFLDSKLVAASVATTTFDIRRLVSSRMTIYLQIPPSQLAAQRSLLRCWVSSLTKIIGEIGSERFEVLMLLDEASALGSLPALEEVLVRGRSAGVRLLLAYQSGSQVEAAFPNKRTLLYDNCSTHIYLGASSYETAERISKSLGEYTQIVESYGNNRSSGSSWQETGTQGGTSNVGNGSSLNYAASGRALLKPEEVLNLDPRLMIIFVRGVAPIMARRLLYYSDPLFVSRCLVGRIMSSLFWWTLMLGAIAFTVWSIALKGGFQWPR
jgi:type IV secretion system protein VirD4